MSYRQPSTQLPQSVVSSLGLTIQPQPVRLGRRSTLGRQALGAASLALLVAGASGCKSGPELAPSGSTIGTGVGIARLQRESFAVRPLAKTRWSSLLLDAGALLPPIPPRRLLKDPGTGQYFAEAELRSLSPAQRSTYQLDVVSEEDYYFGPSGSPLFYVRLLDLVGENVRGDLVGRRLLEWNYESVAALRLLAAQGAQVVGVSASPRLRALYSQPGDQGDIPMFGRDQAGRLTLLAGQFPVEAATRAQVGQGYDVILARNLLKRGYVHPVETSAAAAATKVELGMADEAFLQQLLAMLKPQGRVLLYNICPPAAPPPAPYSPDSDCRNPFTQAQWQAAGFRVRDYDRNDSAALRELGHALGWDQGQQAVAIDNLIGTYTLVERL